MSNAFFRVINWFIPHQFKQLSNDAEASDELRKIRLTIGFLLIVSPLVMLVWLTRLLLENYTQGQIYLMPAASLISLSFLFWIKYKSLYRQAAWACILMTLIIVPIRMIGTGGFSSTATTWYCLAPIMAGMLIGVRAVVFTTLSSLLTLFFISQPQYLGLHITPFKTHPSVQFVAFSFIFCLISGLTLVYELQRRQYLGKITQKKESIENLNQLLKTMMESIGQGFLIFDRNGLCLSTYTKACETLLESIPTNKYIWDVLKLDIEDSDCFKEWLLLVYDPKQESNFESLKGLAPEFYQHSQQRKIGLRYYPVFLADQLEYVVMTSHDETDLIKANLQIEREKNQAEMILKMTKNPHLYLKFDQTFNQLMSFIEEELESPTLNLKELFFALHSLKGAAAGLNYFELAQIFHQMEEELALQRKRNEAASSLDLFSGLKKSQQQYQLMKQEFNTITGGQLTMGQTRKSLDRQLMSEYLDFMIQSNVCPKVIKRFEQSFLYDELGEYFAHYNDFVANLAIRLKKKVSPIEIRGGELKFDMSRFQSLFNSFDHFLRNALDHGIEPPAERVSTGKPERGQLIMSFELAKDHTLIIEIRDDGRGVDIETLKKKIYQKNPGLEQLSEQQVLDKVFESNISSKNNVSLYSGRGVGMDIIRQEARKLGGEVSLKSEPNKGTSLIVRVPFYAQESYPQAS